jgi:AmmeMemoRadiSam system protein B
MRKPAVAGMFYPGDKLLLKEMIKDCYLHELGPGRMPRVTPAGDAKRTIKGAIVPHAGYTYSGPVAAHVFDSIARDGLPELFVVIGPNHRGRGKRLAVTTDDFSMPMGKVRNATDVSERLVVGNISRDSEAHAAEHSLEVQIPFIQHLDPDLPISMVCMRDQSFAAAKEVGEAVHRACQGRDAIILASTDFTHCGSNYGLPVPAGLTAGDYARKQDGAALKKIKEMDPEGLVTIVKENDISMCGSGPVAAMLVAAKLMGATGAKLLKYSTSYDIQPSDSAVGYGGWVIR